MEDFFSINNNSNKSKGISKIIETKSFYLNRSNSESDFVINIVKERRKIIRRYLRKKNKITSYVNTNTNSKKNLHHLKRAIK